ncbi:MAG: hypothetical protein V8S95_07595 [Odoribacter sp.]
MLIFSSPFILQEHYRLSPLGYSLCFAVNAVALIRGQLLPGVLKVYGGE